MRGVPITNEEISNIKHLRATGHSLPEIMRESNRGSSTVFKYIRGVTILHEYADILKAKQGGSKKRAEIAWINTALRAAELIPERITFEQQLFLLVGLYWGEGNKHEFNLINSDPGLVKTFLICLRAWGIGKDQIKIGLRLHSGLDRVKAITFWANFLEIDHTDIKGVEVIKEGRKRGKLKYGMCRVRVAKSAPYFKLMISLINEVKIRFNAAVVQRIEQGTPKP